jgi:hypothetical protein
MTTVRYTPGVAADDSISDLSCHRCGYDLRGLSLGSACPECGLAARDSYEMWFARPPRAVMQRFRIGAALVAASFGVPFPVGMLTWIHIDFLWAVFLVPLCFVSGGWLMSGYLGSRSAGHLLTERRLIRAALAAHACAAGGVALGLTFGYLALSPSGVLAAVALCVFVLVVLGFVNIMSLIMAADTFSTRALGAPQLGAACRLSLFVLVVPPASAPMLIVAESRVLVLAVVASVPLCFAAVFVAVSWKAGRTLKS